MSTLTIRLPDDTCHRLKQLAVSRGISLNKLVEELSTVALASYDTETRFRALAATSDRQKALDILARLDIVDRQQAFATLHMQVIGHRHLAGYPIGGQRIG